jgi:hypothetical protein
VPVSVEINRPTTAFSPGDGRNSGKGIELLKKRLAAAPAHRRIWRFTSDPAGRVSPAAKFSLYAR